MIDPYRRTVRGILLVVGVMGAVSACSSVFQQPEQWSRPCGVIIDASGSGDKFRAEDRLRSKLDLFLADQKCGELSFVPLNSFSDTSACNENRLPLDPPVGDPETTRKAMRGEALTRSLRLLDCARKEEDNSDVLGALRRAAAARPAGTGSYAVLVVSDMIQIDDRVNMLKRDLRTPPARAKLIDEFADLTPNLADTVLFPTDLSTNIEDARLGQNVKAFWTELFATDRAGHPTMEETYV